jgi:hypothetical protein
MAEPDSCGTRGSDDRIRAVSQELEALLAWLLKTMGLELDQV